MKNMIRQYYMDNLRATLVLSGIFLHSILFLIPTPLFQEWPIRNISTQSLFYYLMLFIHVWYMPLFYFLAGYFSYYIFAKRGYWGFIKHRFFRIALPFLICFFLLSLYNTGSFIAHYKSGMPLNSSTLYFYFSFIGPFWFLYYLLLFYVIILMGYSLYRWIFKSFVCKYQSLIICTLFIFDFLILVFSSNPLILPPINLKIDFTSFCIYFSFFMFGWINATNKNNLSALAKVGWLLLLIGLVILFPTFIWIAKLHPLLKRISILDFLILLGYLLSAWLIVLGILGIYFRWITGFSKLLRYIADASYWLYLTQVPIILILQAYFVFFDCSALFKLISVYIISIFIMLLSYALFVRKTFIGVLLNGERRYTLHT